jgi:hypothetical protein
MARNTPGRKRASTYRIWKDRRASNPSTGDDMPTETERLRTALDRWRKGPQELEVYAAWGALYMLLTRAVVELERLEAGRELRP